MTIIAPEDDPDDIGIADQGVSLRWKLNSQRARDNDRALRGQNMVANTMAAAAIPTPPALANALAALTGALTAGNSGGFVSTDKANSPGPIFVSLSLGQALALAAKLNAGPK